MQAPTWSALLQDVDIGHIDDPGLLLLEADGLEGHEGEGPVRGEGGWESEESTQRKGGRDPASQMRCLAGQRACLLIAITRVSRWDETYSCRRFP